MLQSQLMTPHSRPHPRQRPPLPSPLPSASPSPSSTPSSVTVPNLTEMSKATGITLSHLSRVWSGQRGVSVDVARQIADYLEVSVDELFLRLDAIKGGATRVMTGATSTTVP